MTLKHATLAAATVLLVAGCGRFPTPVPPEPASSRNVVVVAAEGKLATSTPEGEITPIPPTPTFDPGFASVLTPLAGSPTATPIGLVLSPSPELRPTRTVAPTLTPFPTIEIPPTATRLVGGPAPTRPPPPPTRTPVRATGTPTRIATPTRVDPMERAKTNNDLASATALTLDKDVTGLLSSASDVDVFKFEIDDDSENLTIRVTLTGQDIDSYRLYLLTPGQRSSAYGTARGATSRQIILPVKGELGTWYVEVAPVPNRPPPRGNYTLKVTTRSQFDAEELDG